MTPGDAAILLAAAQDLAGAQEVEDVTRVVRRAARTLTRADGVTFVLREGDEVRYADEDAIAPLWKGSRFAATACISGWAMIHRRSAVVADVELDDRIPQDLYRRTFVRSLAMVPVGREDPIAAIGAYWARRHLADGREVALLEALAGLASVALANVALRAELRRVAGARDDFLVVASHELRTPLAPLKLRLQSALRRIARGDPPGDVRDAILLAEGHVDRLAKLADDLLDASRTVAQRLEVHPEEVDLGALAREVARRFQAAGHGAVAVRLGAPVRALVDPRRTAQVLAHLLSNAAKFGGGRPVAVRIDALGARARVVVRDEGIGIAPQDQARIFERFERAASDRHFGGLGLGLWLAREIVEAHGGRIDVESRPGAGAAFTILLPLARHAAAPRAGAGTGGRVE
jgi:two-component system CheB/CheR fusion protein